MERPTVDPEALSSPQQPPALSLMQPEYPAPALSPAPTLHQVLRPPLLLAGSVVFLFFGVLGAWSALAPLASGAIAPGTISPEGSRRVIQHLEGGLIGEILVDDGSYVDVGQSLLVLEDTQASASVDLLQAEFRTLSAMRARLLAEQTGAAHLEYSQTLRDAAAANVQIAEVLAAQERLFVTRHASLERSKAILKQRIAQLREEIAGLKAQIVSQDKQIRLLGQEIRDVGDLVAKNLARRPRLLALQRQSAEIEGKRAANRSAIARSQQAIGETELQIINLDDERQNEIDTQLTQIRTELTTLAERLRSGEDILSRTVITAPVSGTVVGLRFHTAGGVIGPGEAVLEIVPQEDDLIVDVRVSPTDIDIVQAGLEARVRLLAFEQRHLPQINGTVRSISADSLMDEATGMSFFQAKVEVDRDHLDEVAPEIELIPGMPAEVLIVTGERTTLDYLLRPILDSFFRSFREA